MDRVLHRWVFAFAVIWTLALLLLGSVVHATESSLACPDWPTCFGTMMPEMVGGVFYEHLHRLWAGGLVLIWAVGTVLAFREGAAPWIRKAAVWGLVLLLVQSVLGGLTVLFRLPDAISTSHLGLAFLFLGLATVMAARSRSTAWGVISAHDRAAVFHAGSIAAAVVFIQSLVGAAVRHTDSGLACPDVPRCIGEWIPPLEQWPIALHYTHRVLALLTALVVVAAAAYAIGALRRSTRERGSGPNGTERWGVVLATASVVLVVLQIALGVLSVTEHLAVLPVSLHTLVAASLLASLVGTAALGMGGRVVHSTAPPPTASTGQPV